jgi:formimidoylglutamate deiminase
MYRLALSLNPDELESIATMAYSEMLRFGLTHVVEFHYLHHDRSGSPYADPTELSQRLIAAAKHAGINLCLVPIFYQLSGFGEVAKPEQRRFVFKSLDQYMDVIRRLEPLTANLGIGVHSLRAADSDSCKAILNFQGSYPTHIHLAEQVKEVDACRAHYGCEPLRWILDHVELKEKHALTHVTHTTTADLLALARSKAVTILCPTTEANLGDGIFPLLDYHQAGGRWCTGSDSQVSLNPCEELRWLDYQLRLKHQRRNPLCANPEDESGTLLLRNHIQYGSQVFYGKSKTEFFQANETFSGLSLDLNHPVLLEKPLEKILSSFVFTSDPSAIAGTITAGEWQVRGGRHRQGRRQDGDRRSYRPRTEIHRGHRRQLWRRQLRHVRPRLFPALPLHVAQRPHLRHGR